MIHIKKRFIVTAMAAALLVPISTVSVSAENYDNVNNEVVELQSIDGETETITSSYAMYDDGPTVDLTSIQLSTQSGYADQTVEISMDVTDDADIEYVEITFKDESDISVSTDLEFDESTHRYKGEIVIKDYFREGKLSLYSIETRNINNERTLIYNSKLVDDDSFLLEDLSMHAIDINGVHGPYLVKDSLEITEQLDYEHQLKISFKIENRKYTERRIRIGFIGPKDDNSTYDNLEYFDVYGDSEGNYSASLDMDQKFEEGEWKLNSMHAMRLDEHGEWDGHLDFNFPEVTGFQLNKIIDYDLYFDPESIEVSKATYEFGDLLEVSIEPNQSDEPLNQVNVNLSSKDNSGDNQTIYLGYDSRTNRYSGRAKVNSAFEVGEYYIDSIVQFLPEDTTRVYNKIENDGGYVDLSKGNFDILMPDDPTIFYKTIQGNSWQIEESNGQPTGGEYSRSSLNNFRVDIANTTVEGNIEYRAYLSEQGWVDWTSDNTLVAHEGNRDSVETLELKLNGEIETLYDIYYSVYVEDYGWLGWAKNGESAGTTGFNKNINSVKIQLVSKENRFPGERDDHYFEENFAKSLTYQTHVEKYGWQDFVKDGEMSGTSGEAKRLEGIIFNLADMFYDGTIEYRTHVESYGWLDWVKEGNMSGTEGEAKRLEAIQLRLTNELSEHYDIYYRVHAESYGWLDWAENGEAAGTAGLGKRLEGIEVRLIEKGEQAPGSTDKPYVDGNVKPVKVPSVSYATHVQTYGWQETVKDGKMSGTSGEAKRLESIKIDLENIPYVGDIYYTTHVQSYGWQDYVKNGELSGTSGEAKRLEAIRIELTGELAEHYDVYYHVHAESYGWLGWAKNGTSAGTEGLAKRLEGIEILLIEKSGKAPGNTDKSFIK